MKFIRDLKYKTLFFILLIGLIFVAIANIGSYRHQFAEIAFFILAPSILLTLIKFTLEILSKFYIKFYIPFKDRHKLKKAKTDLELGLITKEEYNQRLNEYKLLYSD